MTAILFFSLTASYGQALKGDSACYSAFELRKIAEIVIDRDECRELLGICDSQVHILSKSIQLYQKNDSLFMKIVTAKDSIINYRQIQVMECEQALEDQKKYGKRMNFILGGGLAVTFSLLVLSLL